MAYEDGNEFGIDFTEHPIRFVAAENTNLPNIFQTLKH